MRPHVKTSLRTFHMNFFPHSLHFERAQQFSTLILCIHLKILLKFSLLLFTNIRLLINQIVSRKSATRKISEQLYSIRKNLTQCWKRGSSQFSTIIINKLRKIFTFTVHESRAGSITAVFEFCLSHILARLALFVVVFYWTKRRFSSLPCGFLLLQASEQRLNKYFLNEWKCKF